MADALAKARRHWQTQYRAEPPPNASPETSPRRWSIAISREAGTNGPAIARALSERLGWLVYDRELIQKIADEMGLHAGLLQSVDEKQQGWLRECLRSFTTSANVSEAAFVRKLVETLLSLAAHGECVIVGRGAATVLPAATTLRVRLVGPVRERIEAMRQHFGITWDEAERWVEKTDRERKRFVLDHFNKDPSDARYYDLVLNTSRFTVKESADFIVEALRHLQARTEALVPALSH
jgi:cytidylate kinase